MKKGIIAVFGGSFNPPTIAHIGLAKQILEKVENVEKVIFVPVSTKYNKTGLASDEVRFEMLQKICANEKGLEVSSVELDNSRQFYTIETLNKIKEKNKNKDVYFILGTDNLKELETWHKVEDLLRSFKILILKRDNDCVKNIIEQSKILKKYKNSFLELKDIKQIELSASFIREKIQKGEKITDLVPENIEDIVVKTYK